ncbi:MAG TPA: C4-dicarboxylic acid transporter DauA [Gemmatimonadales bacterium]|nr:C4-dicarboxylic acid transporter DauA [Gemmatimonadales bacterium]
MTSDRDSSAPPRRRPLWKHVRRRYRAARQALPEIQLTPALALREVFAEGYGRRMLRNDLLAGVVVGIVALPLSMALAIASGVPPQHGLYTAIVGGAVIAALGGSRVQVSGPTAAFVVILVPVVQRFGVGGLLMATLMAGLILILMGLTRTGRLIQFVPLPVTAGFTAGIAVVIATLQLKDFLGLSVAGAPEHYVERVAALIASLPTLHWPDLLVGVVALGVLLLWPRLHTRIPAPLVALAVAAAGAVLARRVLPGFDVATIASRFSYLADGVVHPGIPRQPPMPLLPWHLTSPDGQQLGLSFRLISDLLPSAFAIAMLGAIESLLSAVVADGMAGTKHDPDTELIAQGAGNLIAPFFGGFAATGAIARTATNFRAGARSPVAAITHSVVVLAAVLAIAPLLGLLPMAALAALLLVVAWNMSDVQHCIRVIRVAPRSDALVLISCFALTVLFDMVVAVTAGVLLAAVLFMRRMAELSGARLIEEGHPALREPLPPGVVLYEIAGPLFFGAAEKAMESLHDIAGEARVVILDIGAVPVMDATGMVNLESALDRLHRDHTLVILARVQDQPAKFMARAGIEPEPGLVAFADSVEEAVALARTHTTRSL